METSYVSILRRRILEAVSGLRLEEADRLLRRSFEVLTPREAAMEFLPALLLEVGDRWAKDELRVVQEHSVSTSIRSLLGGLLASTQTEGASPTVVATTPAGERHEFGAMLVTLLSNLGGWRAVYLGPDLPAEEIVLGAVGERASLVLLSAVALPRDALLRELSAIRDGLPQSVRIVVGGAAAVRHQPLPPADLVTDLLGLESFLASLRVGSGADRLY